MSDMTEMRDMAAEEEIWEGQFSKSQDLLSKLAAEAREEVVRGNTTVLDPDKL